MNKDVIGKVVQISKGGNMFKVESTEKTVWYFLDEKITKYVKDIVIGDTIKFGWTQKGSDRYIIFCTKVENNETKKEQTKESVDTWQEEESKPAGKLEWVENVNNPQIELLKACVEAIKGLEGVDINNVWDVIITGYDKLSKKIGV